MISKVIKPIQYFCQLVIIKHLTIANLNMVLSETLATASKILHNMLFFSENKCRNKCEYRSQLSSLEPNLLGWTGWFIIMNPIHLAKQYANIGYAFA